METRARRGDIQPKVATTSCRGTTNIYPAPAAARMGNSDRSAWGRGVGACTGWTLHHALVETPLPNPVLCAVPPTFTTAYSGHSRQGRHGDLLEETPHSAAVGRVFSSLCPPSHVGAWHIVSWGDARESRRSEFGPRATCLTSPSLRFPTCKMNTYNINLS